MSATVQHPLSARSSLSAVLPIPRLREWRNKRALSQEELAKRSGISRTTIIKIEAGRGAWPQTVRKLAKALGIKPADLQA